MRELLSLATSLTLLTTLGFYGVRGYAQQANLTPQQRERSVVAQLGLTPEQKRQKVKKHQAWLAGRIQERAQLVTSDDRASLIEHDAQTIRQNQAGMKAILTPEQHKKYLIAWAQLLPHTKSTAKPSLAARSH